MFYRDDKLYGTDDSDLNESQEEKQQPPRSRSNSPNKVNLNLHPTLHPKDQIRNAVGSKLQNANRSFDSSHLDDFIAQRDYNNSRADMLRHQLALNKIDDRKLMRYKHFIGSLEKFSRKAQKNSDDCFELQHAFVKWKLVKIHGFNWDKVDSASKINNLYQNFIEHTNIFRDKLYNNYLDQIASQQKNKSLQERFQDEIKVLKATIKMQDTELTETRTKLNCIYDEYQLFHQTMGRKEEEFNEILNEVQNKLVFVQVNGDNLKKANDELHRINTNNQDLYKQLKLNIKDKDDQLEEKSKIMDSLKKALEDKNNHNQELTTQIEKQEYDQQQKINEHRNNEHKYNEKVENFADKIKELTNEKLSLQKIVINQESKHSETGGRVESLSKELDYVKPQMIEFKDNLDQIKQKFNEMYSLLDDNELPIDVQELTQEHLDSIIYSRNDLIRDDDLNRMKLFTDALQFFYQKLIQFMKELGKQTDIPQLSFTKDGMVERGKNIPKDFIRSAFMKNINKVKSKESFDDPSTNPQVINLAKNYKDKLYLHVVDQAIIEKILEKIWKRLHHLEQLQHEQLTIMDQYDFSKMILLIDRDEHSMAIMDKIMSLELQKILDLIYHFSCYENELNLVEYLFNHFLEHFRNHFYWEKPWAEVFEQLKRLRENILIFEKRFKTLYREFESKIMTLLEIGMSNTSMDGQNNDNTKIRVQQDRKLKGMKDQMQMHKVMNSLQVQLNRGDMTNQQLRRVLRIWQYQCKSFKQHDLIKKSLSDDQTDRFFGIFHSGVTQRGKIDIGVTLKTQMLKRQNQ